MTVSHEILTTKVSDVRKRSSSALNDFKYVPFYTHHASFFARTFNINVVEAEKIEAKICENAIII